MAKFSIAQRAAHWGELDEPPAGEDLRKSVAGFWHNAGFGGPPALDGVMQDEIFD